MRFAVSWANGGAEARVTTSNNEMKELLEFSITEVKDYLRGRGVEIR